MPAISTRSWILCSEQNIVRARDDNISGKWVNGVVIYIYIYLSKIRKEAPFYLSRNWVRKETTLGEPVLWGNWKKKKEKIVRSNEMGWDDISRMQTRIII